MKVIDIQTRDILLDTNGIHGEDRLLKDVELMKEYYSIIRATKNNNRLARITCKLIDNGVFHRYFGYVMDEVEK